MDDKELVAENSSQEEKIYFTVIREKRAWRVIPGVFSHATLLALWHERVKDPYYSDSQSHAEEVCERLNRYARFVQNELDNGRLSNNLKGVELWQGRITSRSSES